MRIHLGTAVGHPIRQQFASARAVFHPDSLTEPQIFDIGRFTDDRATVGGHREQTVEGASLFPGQLCQYRRQLYGTFKRLNDLIQRKVIHRG